MIQDERLKIYADRLFEEWKTHGKVVLGVDFDNTLSPYHTLDNQSDIDRTIQILKVCKETGCYIFIHTSCSEDRHDHIRDYCKSIKLDIDTINENPVDLPYGKAGSKPFGNLYLDDKAALPVVLDILEDALYKMRAYKQSQFKLDDAA